jgi:pimeloyl-ACP methyl ester carboxylesterase
MVITGTKDTTILPRVQQLMAERIPGAERHLIDGAGHGVIVDHFAEVNRLLLEFMTRVYSN